MGAALHRDEGDERRGKRKVLVVDDDVRIREMLCRYLELSGFETQSADNGISAMRLMKGEGFDIVITDYDMPGMGGIELIMNIRPRFAPGMIIGMSGLGARERDFMNAGANAFFAKPLELEDILNSLGPSHAAPQAEG